jgi:hypothetical protein
MGNTTDQDFAKVDKEKPFKFNKIDCNKTEKDPSARSILGMFFYGF